MTEPVPAPESLPDPTPASPRPLLGRVLAAAVLAMFIMVALGVFWVWQRAAREQAWRESLEQSGALPPNPAPER